MKILYIWDADYPWDIRVEKICDTLRKHGHEVHIAARNLNRLEEFAEINGLKIHRIRTWQNEKLNYLLSFPAFFSPVWKRFLNGIIEKQKIELIIVRDLPMAIAGIRTGRKYGLAVIFDMAENYVAMLLDIWNHRKFKSMNFVTRNPYLAKRVEKYVFNKINHILVVVEEAKNMVIEKGVRPEKVTIVSNTPSPQFYTGVYSKPDTNLDFLKNKYTAIYIGGLQLGRGLQIVLNAIPMIVKKVPEFLFLILGDGYAKNMIQDRIEKLGIQDYVFMADWVEHDKLVEYFRSCSVGVIPHYVTEHKNTTVPNKLFDYMAFGLPVLASESVPIKRIIEEEKCGHVFRNADSEDFAGKLLQIYHSDIEYGKNGIEAVKKKYNWDIDSERLASVIRKFEE